jgi:SAM-dependent methyltransferase
MSKIPSKRLLFKYLLAGAFVILSALGIRYYLYERVANRKMDPSPLPRPEVNAPFVITPERIVERMLELAETRKSDLVYDLGCGDGRIVVAAAKKYGCHAVGFDIDPQKVREARENAAKNGVEELVTIEEKDIFTCDLSQADVVTLYLLPWMNLKLIPQLEKLKPGARIISHDWDLGGIPPDRALHLFNEEDNHNHVVYLWIAPLKNRKKGAEIQ